MLKLILKTKKVVIIKYSNTTM